MDIRKQFSKNLNRALSMQGVKQVELAEAVELPPTTISGWCCGRHLPDLERLMMICEYLDMPAGELIGDPRHPEVTQEEKNFREEYAKQYRQVETLVKRNRDLEAHIQKLEREEAEQDISVGEISLLNALKSAGVKEVCVKF